VTTHTDPFTGVEVPCPYPMVPIIRDDGQPLLQCVTCEATYRRDAIGYPRARVD
jgi:hypothetical protein